MESTVNFAERVSLRDEIRNAFNFFGTVLSIFRLVYIRQNKITVYFVVHAIKLYIYVCFYIQVLYTVDLYGLE